MLLAQRSAYGAGLLHARRLGAPARDLVFSGPGTPLATSTNQSGGITAHTVNQAPEPELRFGPLSNRRNPDGTYTITCTMDVIAPYPPAELSLQVEAAGIASLHVNSERARLHRFGHSGLRDGWGFTSLVNPSERYIVTVIAAEPRFGVAHRFD